MKSVISIIKNGKKQINMSLAWRPTLILNILFLLLFFVRYSDSWHVFFLVWVWDLFTFYYFLIKDKIILKNLAITVQEIELLECTDRGG